MTTPVEIEVITVRRYRCPHCRRTRSSQARTAEHVARCWRCLHGLDGCDDLACICRCHYEDEDPCIAQLRAQVDDEAETGRAPARIDGAGRTGAGAGERVDDAQDDSGGRDG